MRRTIKGRAARLKLMMAVIDAEVEAVSPGHRCERCKSIRRLFITLDLPRPSAGI